MNPSTCSLCARCRLQILLRQRFYLLRQQRQWLSYTTLERQEAQLKRSSSSSSDRAHAPYGRPQTKSYQGALQPGHVQEVIRQDEVYGRYSRKPLRPEEVLQQLSVAPRQRGPRHPPSPSAMRPPIVDQQIQSESESDLAEMQRRSLNTEAAEQDEEMWKVIRNSSEDTGRLKSRDERAKSLSTKSTKPTSMLLNNDTKLRGSNAETDRFLYLCIKRLSRAVEHQDVHRATELRNAVRRFGDEHPDNRIPLNLYEHLILSFLVLRQSQVALEIWSEMVHAGHQPTVKTYTVLLRGFGQARNPQALERAWASLRGAGIRPDPWAWSARIFGLLKMRKLEDGLTALGEMGREWVTAAKTAFAKESSPAHVRAKETVTLQQLLQKYPGDVDGVARPTVVVMNSAISALANLRDKLIPRVLTWGQNFGIEPDRTTYNALLNIAMRHSMPDEASAILRSMSAKGVDADSTTWTVLLTALFEGEFLRGLSAEEQQQKVLALLDSVENAVPPASKKSDGPKKPSSSIDIKGYSLVVDRLLKKYSNATAAQAVLTHMSARNVRPSPHLYTILMTFYFEQKPTPDFAAVEALWTRIQGADGGYGEVLDAQFYDRMIEMFATDHRAAGSVRPALSFLDRMEAKGKKPSWAAVTSLARALVERQEWHVLGALVEKMKARRREQDHISGDSGTEERHDGSRAHELERGTMPGFGERQFWNLVQDVGLLEERRESRNEVG